MTALDPMATQGHAVCGRVPDGPGCLDSKGPVAALVDAYDGAFFDLDGVIYLGARAVDGAPATMDELGRRGVRVMYVTNNAARSADTVVAHLNSLGLHATLDTVLTSAQVAAADLARELPQGAKILVAGSANLASLLAEAGLVVVHSADDHPVAVIQGYDPNLAWPTLDEACLAIQRGARWFATNDDTSRPTERGIVPGLGGMIGAIAAAIGGRPHTYGKPFRPMLDAARARTGATHPIFVGDRLDTDVLGANRAGLDSLLVFSGAHGKTDLVGAEPEQRPTFIGADVGALLAPPRVAVRDAGTVRCGDVVAGADGSRVTISHVPATLEGQLDAVWAIATLVWGAAEPMDASAALASLTRVH